MFSPISLALTLTFAAKACAHGGVLYYSYGAKWWTGWQPYNSPVGQTSIQRPWSTYNPITSPTDLTLACNDDGNSGALQLTAPVAAGSAITAYWNQVWPHPYGPMLTYLARCPESGCTGVNSNGLKWFKIDQAGLLSGTVASGTWGAGKMIAQNNSWTTTIPSTVPSGNYLIRFETIALHSLPAQMYPECAQIWILGGGSRDPTSDELVTFPGGYNNSDPGLTIDLYGLAAQTMTTYPIPGPPLYGSSDSTGGPVTVPTTPVSTPVSTPTPAPTAGTVAHYGQCGGFSYTGDTGCIAPYTCTVLNPYYSQCL